MGLPFNIKYGTELHTNIAAACHDRFKFSKEYMEKRYDAWRQAEEMHIAYVKADDVDAANKAKRKEGHPEYSTLILPYSYSMLLSAHTYWTTVFLSRDPILQFMGRHGETEQQTQSLEALQAYQTTVGGHLPPYYIWLYDVGKYGLGVIGQYWDDEIIQYSEIKEVPVTYGGYEISGQTKKQRVIMQGQGYSGNRLYNIRPFDFFPDPRVSMQRFQEGEFCARAVSVGWNVIVKRKNMYFNLDVLERMVLTGDISSDDGSQQLLMPATEQKSGTTPFMKFDKGFIKLIEMFVELVPSEWKLGSSDYPEKWVFTLASLKDGGNAIVIGAQPYGERHNKFPFDVLECEMDGYALHKRGFYDILSPLQNAMDWLFNTHFYNVRRVLNDNLFVDPSRFNIKDLLDPQPGKLVRALPSAYGTDIRMGVHQLQVGDVTRSHLGDAASVGDLMQRAVGVNDSLMGMMNASSRRSATEVRQGNAFGVNRQKTMCEWFGACGWTPHAMKLVAATQQHYNKQMQLRIAGDLTGVSGFIQVNPNDIAGMYDFVSVDGNMPIDRFAQVNLWTTLLGQMRQFPTVMNDYDVVKIFGFVARLAGLKNIDQFKVQVQPNAQITAAAQAGNIVPVSGPPPIPPGGNFPMNLLQGRG